METFLKWLGVLFLGIYLGWCLSQPVQKDGWVTFMNSQECHGCR